MNRVIYLLILASLLALNGCQQQPSEKVLSYQENYEIIGKEKEEMIQNISNSIYDSVDRSNSRAKEVVVGAIYKEGKDVTLPEGRYRITGQLTGNVYLYDDQGSLIYHEIIAPPPFGVETITLDVHETDTIHIDGFVQVFITPVPTQLSTELTPGIWEVGKDIKKGSYNVTGKDLGYLQIFEQEKAPRVFEVIGGDSETQSEVHLKDGQKLKITGLTTVKFDVKP